MISIERTDPDGGRVAVGSTFHCHHQNSELDYTIIDWDPPSYFTANGTAFGMRYHVTWRVSRAGPGASRVEFNFDSPYEGDAAAMQPVYAEGARAMAGRDAQLAEQAIREGRLNRSK